VDIFALQERAIAHILTSVQEQQALKVAPQRLDPVQQTVVTALRGYLHHPAHDRDELRDLMRFLSQPLPGVHVRTLRAAHGAFAASQAIEPLLEAIRQVQAKVGTVGRRRQVDTHPLRREDLHLICFDYVWS
jgi:hypothetical protein